MAYPYLSLDYDSFVGKTPAAFVCTDHANAVCAVCCFRNLLLSLLTCSQAVASVVVLYSRNFLQAASWPRALIPSVCHVLLCVFTSLWTHSSQHRPLPSFRIMLLLIVCLLYLFSFNLQRSPMLDTSCVQARAFSAAISVCTRSSPICFAEFSTPLSSSAGQAAVR